MTKKSQSRMRRDAFKENNTAWDDLMKIYTTNQSKLNAVVTSVDTFFRITDIALFIPAGQREFTIQSIRGLSSDIKIFQTRLNDIYKQHKDEKGMMVYSDHNYVRMTSIGSQYMNFEMDYQTILQPLYNQILGIMHSIEARVNELAALADKEAEETQEPQPAPVYQTTTPA